MSEVFGPVFSDSYDAIYRGKDYESECDMIERAFRLFGRGKIETVLDLGCGTGNHVLPLARRGYSPVGVDRSSSMLEHARRKAEEASVSVEFVRADLREVSLERRFDAVLMMFAVLGYQIGNEDVMAALQAARSHLRGGGLFLFDVWYGPAVLVLRPADRVKRARTPAGEIVRKGKTRLDAARQACDISFHTTLIEGGRVAAETEERHLVRFFFPEELKLFLSRAGFDLLRLGVFPDFEKDPDESTWNVLGVARALK